MEARITRAIAGASARPARRTRRARAVPSPWRLLLLVLVDEPIARELLVERRAVDPRELGGLRHAPARLAQEVLEELPLPRVARAAVAPLAGRARVPGLRRELGREVRERDRLAPGEEEAALDRVLQLADVPGPGMVEERLHRVRVGHERRAREPERVLLHEVIDEERDVLAPVAERRQPD